MGDGSALGKLAASAAVVFVATMFGRSLGFLAEILIVRSLDPATYGDLSLAYTIVVSVSAISLFGVHEGITRLSSASDSVDGRIEIAWVGILLLALSAALSALVLFTFRGHIGNLMGSSEVPYLLVLFLPYLFAQPMWKGSKAILRARESTVQAVFSRNAVGRITPLIVFLVVGFGAGHSSVGALLYWLLVPATSALAAAFYIARSVDLRRIVTVRPERSTFKRMWAFSWPLAISSGVFLLLRNADVLMVGYFLDSTQVGFYRAVQPLKLAATFAISSFTFLFLPLATAHYTNGEIDELDQLFTVSTKWMLLFTLPFVLTFALFSPDVVRIFFGQEYSSSASVLTILVGGLLIRSVSGLDGDMVKAIDRPKIELVSGSIGLCSNIVFNAVAIPLYGINGAAFATVLGYLVYNGIEVAWIWKLTGVTPFSLKTTKYTVSMMGTGVLLTLAITSQLRLHHLIAIGVLLTAIQPVLLIITKSVDRADIELLEHVEERFGISLAVVKNVARHGL